MQYIYIYGIYADCYCKVTSIMLDCVSIDSLEWCQHKFSTWRKWKNKDRDSKQYRQQNGDSFLSIMTIIIWKQFYKTVEPPSLPGVPFFRVSIEFESRVEDVLEETTYACVGECVCGYEHVCAYGIEASLSVSLSLALPHCLSRLLSKLHLTQFLIYFFRLEIHLIWFDSAPTDCHAPYIEWAMEINNSMSSALEIEEKLGRIGKK